MAFQATRFRNCQTVLVFPFLVVVVVAADEMSQHAFDTRRKGSWKVGALEEGCDYDNNDPCRASK